ncbi:CHAT domain-containing protein [Aureispira anguillae]|uniref:CHAT domain-containing protein n=1 Tax=Aureispira anguillae TaxID=2864201 RepID=A0A915YFL6_9BACT|nr:CHAT domain-containing protein [Aureispira anguillae]BDS12106.1 CHAT domain-containing protein [Aureispira anguillae]
MSNLATIALLFIFFFLSIEKNHAYQTNPSILPTSLQVLKSKAEHLNNDGLWDESIALYQNIQEQCYALELKALGIDLYEYIFVVTVLREDHDLEDKLNFIEQCSAKETHPDFLGLYYGAIAHAYIYYGEIDSMNKYYDLAYALYTNKQKHLQATNLNVTIATEYYFLGELIAAKEYIQKAEKLLYEKLEPLQLDVPSIYTIQTAIYTELGEYNKALKSNLKSIQIYEADNTTRSLDLAYQYSNLATTYSALKDFENSLSYYQKALSLIKDIEDDSEIEIASLMYNIGATYLKQGNHHAGKEAFLKSFSILIKSKDMTDDMKQDFINNCHLLEDCYRYFNQQDSALYYLKKAEELNKTFPYRIAFTYECYSNIYLGQNNFVKAKIYSEKSLEAGLASYGEKSEIVRDAYRSLAKIAATQRNYKEALFYNQKVLESLSFNFSDENGLSNPKLNDVFRKGDLVKDLSFKMQYLELLYLRDDEFVSAEDLYATAKLATENLELLNKSLKNKNSQLYWLNKEAIPLFEKAIQIAIGIYNKTKNPKYLNEAFMLSEHSKSMLMMGALQENNASSFGGIPNKLVHREKELQKLLAEAEKKRFDANLIGDLDIVKHQDSLIFNYHHQVDALIFQFETEYPKYYQLKYAAQVADINSIQTTLDDSTTFIEYFEGKAKIYAFTITKNQAFVHAIERTPSYNRDIHDFQSMLTNIKEAADKPVNVYNKFIAEAHNLYNKLLKNSLVPHNNRLIIVPDGQLGYIPFDVFLPKKIAPIFNQAENTINFSILPYLIRDYKISYNYSATLLTSSPIRSKQYKNGYVLALAPSYTNKSTPSCRSQYEQKLRKELVELPGATRELEFLKWTFNGCFLSSAEANEANFKQNAPNCSVLHLAVHGLVDNNKPELSGLALEEDMGKKEDNILYAYEIKQLDLQAELVVLSACETGIGKYQRGEGVLSIGRGFMYAGVPSLLTTLWSLNDYSSDKIIKQFYTNLSQGMKKDEAIQQAKLHYLNGHNGLSAYPALWACFIQVGDYSPIQISKKPWLLYGILGFISLLIIGRLLFKKIKRKD